MPGPGPRTIAGVAERTSKQPRPVPPLVEAWESDGVTAIAIGTLLFAIASTVGLFLSDWLTASGRGWWLWVSLCSVGLGLIGLAYSLRRRRSLARHAP